MNSRQRELVRGTLEMLRPISREFGVDFYERLFRLDPSVRALFKGDPTNQEAMFVTALHTAALGLVEDGAVPATVHELGARHGRYGVADVHYSTFKEALLGALAARLGAAGFTPEVREAWSAAYDLLADAMKESAAQTRTALLAAS